MTRSLLTALLAVSSLGAFAQSDKTTTEPVPAPPKSKFYLSGGFDGGIFSLNTVSTSGVTNVPRFAWVINTGMYVNRDYGSHFGLFTGIGVKNLGFIDKQRIAGTMITTKHRTYNIGIPLGIKFGNLKRKGTFVMLGGGVDFPVNYKEKTFVGSRKNKTKETEWFSEEVTPIMPYVFAGVCFKSNFTVKFQYYVNNFMNDELTTASGTRLYPYDTKIGMMSLSWYVKSSGKKGMKNLRTMMKSKSTNTI